MVLFIHCHSEGGLITFLLKIPSSMEAPGRSDPGTHRAFLTAVSAGAPPRASSGPGWASTYGRRLEHSWQATKNSGRNLTPALVWLRGDNDFLGTGNPLDDGKIHKLGVGLAVIEFVSPFCLALLHPSRVSCTRSPHPPFSCMWFSGCCHLFPPPP